MKVKHKASLFPSLHNDISKKNLLPNIITLNVIRNNDNNDAMNLGKFSYVASIIQGTWIHHA